MKYTFFLIGASALLLSGCSVFGIGGEAEYSCPGMPKGVVCKTPREVYDLSINNDSKAKNGKGKYNPGPVEVVVVDMNGRNPEPMPVLEQARVMRIWISPWKDNNDDLHWPGLIFTKIKGHEWAIGGDDFNGIEPPVPRRIAKKLPPSSGKSGGGEAGQNDAKTRLPDVVLD